MTTPVPTVRTFNVPHLFLQKSIKLTSLLLPSQNLCIPDEKPHPLDVSAKTEVLLFTSHKQDIKEIPSEMLDLLHSQLLTTARVFESVSSANVVKLMVYVTPILLAVGSLLSGTVKIKSSDDVCNRNTGVSVHVDHLVYVAGEKCRNRNMCVVLAYEDDLERAMVQAVQAGKILSERGEKSRFYAIATNFRQWYFIKSVDGKVSRDVCTLAMEHDLPSRSSVAKIAGKLYCMMSDL
jgi:hypothetical protein